MAGVGVVVTLVGGSANAGSSKGAGAPVRREAARVYVVRPGDTLWGIAARLAGPRSDPRPVVDLLVSANHLSGSLLPGDRLVLPG